MYQSPTTHKSSAAEQHVRDLFQQRGKNDPNSTTLANTLDKDIQTVFNSAEKFAFELLQNGDDAGLPDLPVDISFKLCGNLLIFSHNGKHFDRDDVEAICDNAQRRKKGKELDLAKTGYKGIGFKSVFVIANSVAIFSKDYTFRFDRGFSTWNSDSHETEAGRYPWQIVPIWTTTLDERFSSVALDREKVNFILEIRSGFDIRKILQTLLNAPQVLLFLRRTRSVTIDCNGVVHTVRLDRVGEIRSLYLDDVLKGQWLMVERTLVIPDKTHTEIQLMGAHECPEKLKQAKQIILTFGAKLDATGRIVACSSPLFCYLPTTIDYQLPFLVNADFLLSADRTQLLNNHWNKYLFGEIGRLHIHWLNELAKNPKTCDQVLLLLKEHILIDHFGTNEFKQIYKIEAASALKEIAFIPSYNDAKQLLKIDEAIADTIQFVSHFPGIDLVLQAKVARYELAAQHKLRRRFDFANLVEKVESYFTADTPIELQKRLLIFIKEQSEIFFKAQTQARSAVSYLQPEASTPLAAKRFLLTTQNRLSSPSALYLPATQKFPIPTLLKFELIHDTLLEIPGLREWLLNLGTKETNVASIFDEIVKKALGRGNLINEQDSLEIIAFLYYAYTNRFIIKYQLTQFKYFPLLTTSEKLKAADHCYLSSQMHPKVDLQKLLTRDDLFVSDRYLAAGADGQQLGEMFKEMGVKNQVAIHPERYFSEFSDTTTIDYYQNYISYLQSKEGVSFFGGRYSFSHFFYMDFLSCLPAPRHYIYIFFWKTVIANWEKYAEYFKPTKIEVRSNKHHQDFTVTPYIVYILSEMKCVYGQDNKLYKTSELYAPDILEKLGPRLAVCFPEIKTKFETFELKLTTEQTEIFKFKTKISVVDCLKLFTIAAQDTQEYLIDNYARIFTAMAQQAFSETEIKQLQAACIKLPAGDGQLKVAQALYYYQGQTTLKEISSGLFLKGFPNIDEEQMQKICSWMGVKLLQPKDMVIQTTGLHINQNLKDRLLQFVPLLALLEERYTKTPKEKAYVKLLETLKSMEILAVSTLIVAYKDNPHAAFPQRLFIIKNAIYYVNDGKRAENDLLKAVAHYLEISDKTTIDFLTIFYYSNEDRIAYLQDHGYRIDFLTQTHSSSSATSMVSEVQAVATAVSHQESHEILATNQADDDADDDHDYFLEKTPSMPEVMPDKVSSHSVDFVSQSRLLARQSARSAAPSMTASSGQRKHKLRDSSTEPASFNDTTSSRSDYAWVGRWGEEMVYLKLEDHYQRKYPDCTFERSESGFILKGKDNLGKPLALEVIWCNKNRESGNGYDVEIIKNGQQRYVEVKSTYHAEKCSARISRNEWELMRTAGHRYRLFCVYNAGSAGVRIAKIKDPAAQLVSGELTPYEIHFKF